MLSIINAIPFINGAFSDKCAINIADGKIVSIGKAIYPNTFDAKNSIVCAGYIDIHTHGGFGKDCMDATKDAIETICKYHLSTGITSFVPTTMTAPIKDIENAIINIREYKDNKYARILGIHLEGPFLSKGAAGAHKPELLVDPSDDNAQFVFNNKDIVSRVTLAPNKKYADLFTKKAVENGIQVSLGHDESIDDEIYACIDNGATSVTHMYNCTSRPSRRTTPKKHLGLTEVGLTEDRLYAEVIADDRHVPNALFKMIYKLKGANKICLVSDSLSIAGMPKGEYYIGSGDSKQKIEIDDGVAVIKELNTYAGSITPISKMVVNLVNAGIKKEDALKMATLNPARLMGYDNIGDIKEGYLADLNILNNNLDVETTILNGEIIRQ
ncbi:MAG: N-acetylglucosamine-6-phosphate deacetylase [Clostridia bacterium]|nr:N-acetylglucosamine-6-phosphate deacetylase [Clostridia bacterium]